jgi:hypothetical protein
MAEMISRFTKANADFKYCKRLYLLILENRSNKDLKERFKNIVLKLLSEISHSLDLQEYKSINVNGNLYVTSIRSILPQEISDSIADNRKALNEIFDETIKLCEK